MLINMIKYKIEIKREDCISCGSCYSLDPEHFEPGEERRSQVINGQTDSSFSSGTFTDDKIEQAQQAEEYCPVSIITITKV